jgi:cell wall-associated NlpC family hydrolase
MMRLPSHLPPLFLCALVVCLTGCATHGTAVPQPFPTPGSNPAAAAPADGNALAPGAIGTDATGAQMSGALTSMVAEGVVSTALHLLGTRYRNGGTDPEGFDCSGFVQYVYAQQGVWVPRTVDEQARSGLRVDELHAGDLVFFRTSGHGPTHVGIAIDGTRFVHAPSSRGEVRVEPLARPYWADRFIEARRLVAAAPAP